MILGLIVCFLLQVNHCLGESVGSRGGSGCSLTSGAQCDPKDGPCCENDCTFSSIRIVKQCWDNICKHASCTGNSAECPPVAKNTACVGCSGPYGCLCNGNGSCVSDASGSRILGPRFEESRRRDDGDGGSGVILGIGLGLFFSLVFIFICLPCLVLLCCVCFCCALVSRPEPQPVIIHH